MAKSAASDPYVYPGSTTLKNRFGLTDPLMLRTVEYTITRQRGLSPPSFPLTVDGFKATHRHLFGELFVWAGQNRTVGLTHPRHQDPFAFPHLIEGSLTKQFRSLAAEGHLAGLDADTFAGKAAHHIGELNAIHAFREGNGRTIRLHLKQLGAAAGHSVHLSMMTAQAWNDASNISFNTGDARDLAEVIKLGMGPRPKLEAEAAQATASLSADGRLVYTALADKISREMVKLSADEKAELRASVAHDLLAKERAAGPIVLTPEMRQAAEAPDRDTAQSPPRRPRR